MPRPRKRRRVGRMPQVNFYKPQGVPMGQLRGVTLSIDGLEALRLVDAEGLDQEAAARAMGVSRPTLSRILAEARGTVARALAHGWALRIEGGDFDLSPGPDSVGASRRGRGHGRSGGHGGRQGPNHTNTP